MHLYNYIYTYRYRYRYIRVNVQVYAYIGMCVYVYYIHICVRARSCVCVWCTSSCIRMCTHASALSLYPVNLTMQGLRGKHFILEIIIVFILDTRWVYLKVILLLSLSKTYLHLKYYSILYYHCILRAYRTTHAISRTYMLIDRKYIPLLKVLFR